MKHLYILLFCTAAFSQGIVKENDNIVIRTDPEKNVNLIFPSEIIQGTVGNQDYRFGFDLNNPGKIGIVKGAKNAQESNLLVITEDKNIYSFILRSGLKDNNINHFITKDMAIGNLDGEIVRTSISVETKTKEETLAEIESDLLDKLANEDTTIVKRSPLDVETSDLYLENKIAYLRRHCSNFITMDADFRRFFDSNSDVFLKLENIDYNKNEIYLVMTIQNDSGVDYDIEFVNFFIGFKKGAKKRSLQKDLKTPIYIYNLPKRVNRFDKEKIVFVFNKFSIDEKKILFIELKENKGERNMLLEILPTDINNPKSK